MPQVEVTSFRTARGRVRRTYVRSGSNGGGPVLASTFEEVCGGTATLDYMAVRAFLWQGLVGGEETLASGVRCLPGDALFAIEPNRLSLRHRNWYELDGAPEAADEDVLGLAREALLTAIHEQSRGKAEHCLGLTAGLDSRLLLAAMREVLPAEAVTTYTFGIPGTWDFDLAPHVAKVAGVQHRQLDLISDYRWTTERVCTAARETDGNVPVLFHHPVEFLADVGAGRTHWSGYLGDTTMGAHLPEESVLDPEDWYLNWHAGTRGVPRQFAETIAPDLPWCLALESGGTHLTGLRACEALDLYNRQERFIANVIYLRSIEGCAPFCDARWSSFILRAPLSWRYGRALQRRMLSQFYPEFAAIPSSGSDGWALLGPRRSTLERPGPTRRAVASMLPLLRVGSRIAQDPAGAVPMGEWIRSRDDVRATVEELILGAAERAFVDGEAVRRLWRRYLRGFPVRWSYLDRIASLEAIIRGNGLRI